MPKRRRVRVNLGSGFWQPSLESLKGGQMHAVIDMLRYAGLLESNVPGFPLVIEYTVNHDPTGQIERWRSFGFDAQEVV